MRKVKNIIIGFGKAGKTLAADFAKRGEETVLIESDKLYGGTCINIGCIPSKSLITNEDAGFAKAMDIKTALVAKLNAGNYAKVADASAEVIDGFAKFKSDHVVEIAKTDGGTEEIEGERIFINTGATPVIPPIDGLDETFAKGDALTSRELLSVDELPEKLVIVGAGYISLEFAELFAKLGSVVVVLEAGEKFLPREDDDAAAAILADMEKDGIRVELGVEFREIRGRKVRTNKGDFDFAKVLIATGRKPNTEKLGLENTNISRNERGAVKVNAKLETTAENVWALGDVNGGPQFTYISLDDYRIVKNQLFGDGKYDTDSRKNVPYSVFTTPTFSRIGLDENQANAAGTEYDLYKIAVANFPKAKVLGDERGFFKALVSPTTNEILGATLYGAESHELINLISLAMKTKTDFREIRDMIFTHPTMSENLNDLFAESSKVSRK